IPWNEDDIMAGAAHVVGETMTNPGFAPAAAASECWDRLNRAVGDAIMDLTGGSHKYDNCGLSSSEIEDAYRDASISEDAASQLAAAGNKDEIEEVISKVEAGAKEAMKEAIREKYKDQPELAEHYCEKIDEAELKGDTWHTGSVSRRQNEH